MVKENLTQLLSQLTVQSTKEKLAEVEHACLELLSSMEESENRGAILKGFLVATIKQDKYERGLKVLQNNKEIDEKYGDQFALEKLYIFYKLNETTKFENLYSRLVPEPLDTILKKEGAHSSFIRGLLHVRAQFCYKNGLYEETFKIYHHLASHNEKMTDNSLELSCNERVPLTADPSLQSNLALSTVTEESYDLLFNDAMILSAKGAYEDATKLLERAHEMALNDGYESDVNAIELQLAFVYQMQGKKESSQKLLAKLCGNLDHNSPFYLLANMNKKAFVDFSKYTTNINLVLRELNSEALNGINLQQFTSEQWSVINRNLLFLHLFNNDSIQSKSTVLSRTLHNYKKLVDNVNFESYKTQAKKLYHHAIKMIKSGTEGSVIGFLLLTLQLLVVEKQWDNAVRICEFFLNEHWKSSAAKAGTNDHHVICCILFELYRITDRIHSKIILLNKLRGGKSPVAKDVVFWKHVAFQNLELGNVQETKRLLKKISKHDSDGLIKEILSEGALDVDEGLEVTQDVDVETLIAAGTKPLESSTRADRGMVMGKVQKKRVDLKKKKKAQKSKKFLKGRDLSRAPDPERWIPKRDRSTYRPKKKQLAKQTQGGAMNKKAELSLDISKKAKLPKKGKNKK